MNAVATLIKPRWWAFRRHAGKRSHRMRALVVTLLGLALWSAIFAVTFRVLTYFQGIADFGDVLADKLLSMVLMTVFSLLVFSGVLTALSKLYLSRDLNLVHALPVRRETVFLARWLESTVDGSWMVVAYTLPVLFSYGLVYRTGPFFYLDILLSLLPLIVTASALSALAVMLAVIVLPATRIRTIVVFLGLGVMILLYVTFRLLKPERLVNPDAFSSVMAYLTSLRTPSAPWLPSTWAYDSLTAALAGRTAEGLFHTALAASAAGFLVLLNLLVARHLYFRGFSKSQTAMSRLLQRDSRPVERLLRVFPGPVRAIVLKELRTFWRDQTQWSQLFLIAALIAVYLYNFYVLPIDGAPIRIFYLQNLLSFLNMALAAFVLIAITARFAFPAVSAEGAAFWIVRAAPVSLRTFLWIKFWIYLLPLLVLAEILIVATNLLLEVSPFMMGLSAVTLVFMTPAVVSIGIGTGAVYPDFASENPAQAVTGFGGLVYMIVSAAYIGAVCMLEAGPVYTLFMARLRGWEITPGQWAWMAASFAAALMLSVLAVLVPIRLGARKLSRNLSGR